MLQTITIIANFVISFGSVWVLYLALRNRLWREYYRFNQHTKHPRDVDRGDKMTSLIFALALGAVWPVAIPAFLAYRYRVMKVRRGYYVAYADEQMRAKGRPYEGE